MRRLWRVLAGVLLVAAVAATAGHFAWRAAGSTSGTVLCTDNPCTVQAANPGNGDGFDGLVIRGAAGVNHALIVTDQGGAPILFTNTNSVSSGDLPFCATSSDLANRVCISPGTWNAAAGQYQGPGLVELWTDSSSGPVVLSARDVREIHMLEAAHLSLADLRWLARNAG